MEHSEFEIQAEIYMRLKSQFPLVRGEYFYEPVDRRTDKYRRIKAHRFDVVVFDTVGKILAVVEVKKRKGKHCIDHYLKSVIAPVLLVAGMDEVPTIIQKVRQAIEIYRPTEDQILDSNEFIRGASAYVA